MDVQARSFQATPYNGALIAGEEGAISTGADARRHKWVPYTNESWIDAPRFEFERSLQLGAHV